IAQAHYQLRIAELAAVEPGIHHPAQGGAEDFGTLEHCTVLLRHERPRFTTPENDARRRDRDDVLVEVGCAVGWALERKVGAVVEEELERGRQGPEERRYERVATREINHQAFVRRIDFHAVRARGAAQNLDGSGR